MKKPVKNYTRDIGKDVLYGSQAIQRFINMLTKDGQKQRAEKIIYSSLQKLMENVKDLAPPELMDAIVAKIGPTVEAVSKRVKGATLPVPVEVNPRRSQMLAFRWLRAGAIARRAKEGTTLANALAGELLDAHEGRGYAIKRRDEVHATAKANRAFLKMF